jgi:hypothetical protein
MRDIPNRQMEVLGASDFCRAVNNDQVKNPSREMNKKMLHMFIKCWHEPQFRFQPFRVPGLLEERGVQ